MEEQPTPILTNIPTVKTPLTNKQPRLRLWHIITIIVIIAVLAGLGFAGKHYYSKLFIKAQNNIGDLQVDAYWRSGDISYFYNQIAVLNAQINDLNNQVSNNTIAGDQTYSYVAPSLDSIAISTFAPSSLPAGQKLLMIDFLAKNTTTSDVYFYSGNYKLKDNNDYQYQVYYSYNNTTVSLPSGHNWADSLLLKPGEQTRGTMAFLLTRTDMTTLSLSDQNNGQPVADLNYANIQ